MAVGRWLRGLFGGNEEPAPSAPPVSARPQGPATFAGQNNQFACAMFAQLQRQPDNVFFSPFGIRMALGMTQAGARGATAVQMRQALFVPTADETLHVLLAEFQKRLDAAGGRNCELVVANSLFVQDGAPLLPVFLGMITRHYGGGMNLVDFQGAAETARDAINRWVEQATRERIRDLIPAGGVGERTRLVLVNAIYFKGMWMLPFPRSATQEQPFHVLGGGSVQVPLMHQQERVRYFEGPGYQAVDLHYVGGDLSMLVLLPDEPEGLAGLEQSLSAGLLHECDLRMAVREVELFLPRFEIHWGTVDLRGPLGALGMKLAFEPDEADFYGINGLRPPHEGALYVSAVFHQAFVEVNEEGTEAAAATAVEIFTMAMRPSQPSPVPVFRADHPFVFAIRDRKSGAVLFLGRVLDPARGR